MNLKKLVAFVLFVSTYISAGNLNAEKSFTLFHPFDDSVSQDPNLRNQFAYDFANDSYSQEGLGDIHITDENFHVISLYSNPLNGMKFVETSSLFHINSFNTAEEIKDMFEQGIPSDSVIDLHFRVYPPTVFYRLGDGNTYGILTAYSIYNGEFRINPLYKRATVIYRQGVVNAELGFSEKKLNDGIVFNFDEGYIQHSDRIISRIIVYKSDGQIVSESTNVTEIPGYKTLPSGNYFIKVISENNSVIIQNFKIK